MNLSNKAIDSLSDSKRSNNKTPAVLPTVGNIRRRKVMRAMKSKKVHGMSIKGDKIYRKCNSHVFNILICVSNIVPMDRQTFYLFVFEWVF